MPFWCDDFDGDLYKVIAGSEAAIKEAADVELFTRGHSTGGCLNNPLVWNSPQGMIAFFGFKDPDSPPEYISGMGEPIRCTFGQAARDAWIHGYIIMIQRLPVWNAGRWKNSMIRLFHHRKGVVPLSDLECARIRNDVLADLRDAARRVKMLQIHYQEETKP